MKKIISLLLIAALSAATVALAAENTENIMPISEENGQTQAQSKYVQSTVSGAELFEEDGVQYVKGIDANGEEIHFVLKGAIVIDELGEKATIPAGAQFTAFTACDKPAPLVLPAVYYPDVIVIDTDVETIADVDLYTKTEETYTNAANTLAVTCEEDIDGKILVVLYKATTRSIPPIAIDPEIFEYVPATEAETKVTAVKAGDKTVEIVSKNDVDMLPVREVSEALGLDVAWDNTLKAVTVGTVPMGINFRVGENAYNKARMTAFELSSAPVIEETAAGGVTYVPVEFFTEVLACEATTADGVMTLIFK